MSSRKLLATHKAPDLDAIGAVWMLKRFDAQHYATAKVAFVNQGETITLEEAEKYGSQLHEVTHVDTGLGTFDHHQPERGHQYICATSLTYDHVCSLHPELKNDQALKIIVEFVTEIDHFGEVYWPEADHNRYSFMIHELIRGIEFFDPHNDEQQLHFGLQCLDAAYAAMMQKVKADEELALKGMEFSIPAGPCIAIETSNDDTVKMAQKRGCVLVVRKDPKLGHVRVKVRPDSNLELKPLHLAIQKIDKVGTWYYHPSGKMLLNGSRKARNQVASPLPLAEVVALIKEIYAQTH
jgi:hypothetical protein